MSDGDRSPDSSSSSIRLDSASRPVTLTVKTAAAVVLSAGSLAMGGIAILQAYASKVDSRFEKFEDSVDQKIRDKLEKFDPLPYKIDQISKDVSSLRGYYDRFLDFDADLKTYKAIQDTLMRRVDQIEEAIREKD